VLADVDTVLGGVLGMGAIGVFPNWGANLTGHISYLGAQVGNVYPNLPLPGINPTGCPAFYLPSVSSVPLAVISNTFHMDYMGGATLDRIAARTLETYYVGAQMLNMFNALNPAQASNKTLNFSWGGGDYKTKRTAPRNKAKGAGLTEAPRGALGHWIVIGKNKSSPKYDKYKGKVANYQIITPTAWNINPKDAADAGEKTLGLMGPIERCIWHTPLVAESEPIEILRVIHSFDPCCACTVHVMNPKKEKVAETTLEALI
jgi:Ni,Fe-hydrogenase I large subunit